VARLASMINGEPEPTTMDSTTPNPYEQNVTSYTPALFEALNTQVDTVAETTADAEKARVAAEQRAARERSRYNVQLTPAEQVEASRLGQIQGVASVAGARTQAIRSDEAINRGLSSSALSILSQNFATALSNALGLSQLDVSRKNALANAQANSRSQHYGFLGGIGNMIGTFIGSNL